jgi:hypothetical protein
MAVMWRAPSSFTNLYEIAELYRLLDAGGKSREHKLKYSNGWTLRPPSSYSFPIHEPTAQPVEPERSADTLALVYPWIL